jgi:hypothetical protein
MSVQTPNATVCIGLKYVNNRKETMAFIATGPTEDDYWLVNGSKEFSILPANTITGWDIDLPIRLHVGNVAYGQIHMQKHVYQIKDRLKRSIPELVHYKLGQGATIYNTEKSTKIKLKFGLVPGALIVMERRYMWLDDGKKDEYLSMTTIYPPWRPLDGEPIGRYDGSMNQRLMLAKAKAAAEAAVAVVAEEQATSAAAGATPQPPAPAKV